MKNIANCTPKEFLVQTNKIRKQAKKWMDITKVMEIRKNMPVLMKVPELSENPTEKELAEHNAVLNKNSAALYAQSQQNISDMLDAALEANVDETVELLAMLCFVDPKEANDYPVVSYLGAFTDIINCPEVISFFTSLMQLGQMNISGTAKE